MRGSRISPCTTKKSPVDRVPLVYNDAFYVAQRMRAADRKEIYATRWTDAPEDLARDVCMCGEFAWTLGLGGEPICCLGALALWPGVWSVWMFATDRFGEIGLSATRFVRQAMIPALTKTGAHRAECRSLAGHRRARAWLELLGARLEGREYVYGKNRERFVTYVWEN